MWRHPAMQGDWWAWREMEGAEEEHGRGGGVGGGG